MLRFLTCGMVAVALSSQLSLSFGQPFTIETADGKATLVDNGSKIMSYQFETTSLDGSFPRANYVHPLYGFNNDTLTEDFPDDHLHQRGIFWTWHQIKIAGKVVADGWDCSNIIWNVKEFNWIIEDETVTLQSVVNWTIDTGEWANQSILEENVSITYKKESPIERSLYFDLHLEPLVEDLCIGGSEDYKGYGGFSLRVIPDSEASFRIPHLIEPIDSAVSGGHKLTLAPIVDHSGQNKYELIVENIEDQKLDPTIWILRRKNSMQNHVFPGRQCFHLNVPKVLRYKLTLKDF